MLSLQGKVKQVKKARRRDGIPVQSDFKDKDIFIILQHKLKKQMM